MNFNYRSCHVLIVPGMDIMRWNEMDVFGIKGSVYQDRILSSIVHTGQEWSMAG